MVWIDPESAASVWQRVRGAPQRDTEELLHMIRREWNDVSVCLYLAHRHREQSAADLRRMARDSRNHAACLTGIYTLATGQRPAITTPPPREEPVDTALRRCFWEKSQQAHTYEAMTGDPEYGFIFMELANRSRDHCRLLLAVLGNTKGKT